MKKAILVFLAVLLAAPVISFSGERTRGYWKDSDHDGIKDQWVEPYQRTHPNSSRTDNYGYPGNYNPNTGRFTPPSQSPRELYPYNPNPYERPQRQRGKSIWN